MLRSQRLRPLHLGLWVACAAAPVWAQVELVDPDAPAVKKVKPVKPVEAVEPATEAEETPPEGDLPIPKKVAPAVKAEPGSRFQAATKGPLKLDPAREPKPPDLPAATVRVPAPPLILTHATDADLEAAWEKWRLANTSNSTKGEATARAELLKLRQELGASDLVAFSQGLLRAAMVHETNGDSAGAIDLALAAVELAPSVPASWLGLAQVYFAVDPSGLPRTLDALKTAALRMLSDPRYLRPATADLANALLTAVTALAVAVVVVLFIRRARYFLFDFHFLFPRALARWQSTAIALLILLLPLLFNLGVAASLLAAFAAVTLYLTTAERVVAAVLIALLGAVPTLGALVARETAFAGTPAEAAYLLDKGANDAEPIAAQLATLAAEDKASFAELFVLGTFELHRGKLDSAIARLKEALQKKPGDARAQVNLGVAMLLGGDLENPRSLFEEASKADPTLAEPLFDLALLYQRRGQTFGLDTMASELDRAHTALTEARSRDPSLPELKEAGVNDKLVANQFTRTVPLGNDELLALAVVPELGDKIRQQLTLTLAADVPEPIAPFFPAFGALLLLGFGALAAGLQVARPCNKCGAPISRRADPEVPRGSLLCAQCVNVFALKGVVPPALKVRKQLEVSRYETRLGRISYALGLACSGMGHVFSGLVVRGTIYGLIFLIVIALFLQRHGVMRVPYLDVPLMLRMVPLGIFFGLIYLLSLRGLYKRQG